MDPPAPNTADVSRRELWHFGSFFSWIRPTWLVSTANRAEREKGLGIFHPPWSDQRAVLVWRAFKDGERQCSSPSVRTFHYPWHDEKRKEKK